jgi:hypothetical protein
VHRNRLHQTLRISWPALRVLPWSPTRWRCRAQSSRRSARWRQPWIFELLQQRKRARRRPARRSTMSPIDANHRVAAATSDGAVGLYELSSPLPTSVVRLRMFPVARPFVALSTRHMTAHDGTSTSHDFTVSMIDLDTGRTLHTFAPHGNTVLVTAISPNVDCPLSRRSHSCCGRGRHGGPAVFDRDRVNGGCFLRRWRASRIGLTRRNGNRLALCRRANAKTSGCCPVTVQADPNARLSA